MTLEEYIAKNYSEEKLNEYSYFSGWHEAILEIVRETWEAAQQGVEPTLDDVTREDRLSLVPDHWARAASK